MIVEFAFDNQDLRKVEEVPLFTDTNIPDGHGLSAVRNRTYQGNCVSPNRVNATSSFLTKRLQKAYFSSLVYKDASSVTKGA